MNTYSKRGFVVVLGLMLMTFIDCGPAVKFLYGITEPKELSDEEVQKLANRLSLGDDIYRVKNFDGAHIGSWTLTSVPSLSVYSSSGHKIDFNPSCTADYDSLINMSVEKIDNLLLEQDEFNLEDLASETYRIGTNDRFKPISGRPTFVILFAKYIGRLNKRNTVPWVEAIKKRDDVNLLILNCDISK